MPRVADWEAATRACERRCEACARCNFISVSLPNLECAWFESCNLEALGRDYDGLNLFRSYAVARTLSDSRLDSSRRET